MAKAFSSFLSAKLFTMVGQVRVHKRDRKQERGVVKFNFCVLYTKCFLIIFIFLASKFL